MNSLFLLVSGTNVEFQDEKIRDFMHKRLLWLADDSSCLVNIDILLRADVSWDFLYGEKILLISNCQSFNVHLIGYLSELTVTDVVFKET